MSWGFDGRELGMQWRRWLVVLCAGRLANHIAIGLEIEWSAPHIVMVRLKLVAVYIGFDFAWRTA